jgi:hypothetical protein
MRHREHTQLIVPLKKKTTTEQVNADQLTLMSPHLNHVCTRNEAIVWALINNQCNVADIQFQMSLLLKEEPTEQNLNSKHRALAIIEEFAGKNLIALKNKDLPAYNESSSQYSHIASTRGGLYLFNEHGYRRLDYGMFFGLCTDQNKNLYAFDFPHRQSSLFRLGFSNAKKDDSCEGVIRQYKCEGSTFAAPINRYSGIGNNTHYLLNHEGGFVAVDTDSQRITRIAPDDSITHVPVFDQSINFHINALARYADNWLVMHSVTGAADESSGFALFDNSWNQIEHIRLPAKRAHDFVLDQEQGSLLPSFWYCDSARGQIKHYPSNKVIAVPAHIQDVNTVRGLSQTTKNWVVGSGTFGRYHSFVENTKPLGSVFFINKSSGNISNKVELPETPCCIIPNPHYRG